MRKIMVLAFSFLFSFSVICSAGEALLNDSSSDDESVRGIKIMLKAKEAISDEEWISTCSKLMDRVMVLTQEYSIMQVAEDTIEVQLAKFECADEEMRMLAEQLIQPQVFTLVTYEEEIDSESSKIIDVSKQNIWITEEDIESVLSASMTTDDGEDYYLEVKLKEDSIEKMAELSAQKMGETLYVYCSGELISSPVVVTEIMDGDFIISGLESQRKADITSYRINAGGLTIELAIDSVERVEFETGMDVGKLN